MLEAKPPAGADRPGGNATTFDWSVLRGWAAPAPWLLAGGLTPDNVAAAIRETGAAAVDVSSGVERRKGVKDAALDPRFHRSGKRPALGTRPAPLILLLLRDFQFSPQPLDLRPKRLDLRCHAHPTGWSVPSRGKTA